MSRTETHLFSNMVNALNRVEGPASAPVDAVIARAVCALLSDQNADGHWHYELEADTTVTSEYVLLTHFLGETMTTELEQKFATYLRRNQQSEGGWPLFPGGTPDISASVKAYFALKLLGDVENAEHMQRARQVIRALGGAERSNVHTRTQLALYGAMPWTAVPLMPIEIMLLPRWFPFHLSKISYWARTVIVPLLVLNAKRPIAKNPRGARIEELFCHSGDKLGLPSRQPHQSWGWFHFFRAADKMVRFVDRFAPRGLRQRATCRAVEFVEARLNGENGFGGIYQTMAHALMMFAALDYPQDHPSRAVARKSIDRLLIRRVDEAYCQLSTSPVWDTSFACLALMETGECEAHRAALSATHWLAARQILDVRGDWISRRPDVRPGGWAFQYSNPQYPDVDDTAVAATAMHQVAVTLPHGGVSQEAIARAREWVVGMQASDGGWGAFEPENTQYYLNNIPFSDHGALLDPPTADVSGRCLQMLGQLGESPATSTHVCQALSYLLTQQETDGSWFGRWGVNYVYGTWTVLCGLDAAGVAHDDLRVRHARQWLLSIQNEDGGWGEDCNSYDFDYRGYKQSASTASQTSWALLGLMATGEVKHPAVVRGINYLMAEQAAHGFWDELRFTGTGFPRGLYLRYHGYTKYFPLWAIARYRNLLMQQ